MPTRKLNKQQANLIERLGIAPEGLRLPAKLSPTEVSYLTGIPAQVIAMALGKVIKDQRCIPRDEFFAWLAEEITKRERRWQRFERSVPL